jgi:hypothetical protein
MALSNFERMIQMAEEVFSVRNDPDQLSVDQGVIKRLHKIHPASVSEYNEGNGPLIWVLLIPTTEILMNDFISGKINEQQLFDLTPLKGKYEAIYLCSAMTLPECRNKGITKNLSLKAIGKIRKTHPVKSLFVWPFSKEGARLAERIAEMLKLPLLAREK